MDIRQAFRREDDNLPSGTGIGNLIADLISSLYRLVVYAMFLQDAPNHFEPVWLCH